MQRREECDFTIDVLELQRLEAPSELLYPELAELGIKVCQFTLCSKTAACKNTVCNHTL